MSRARARDVLSIDPKTSSALLSWIKTRTFDRGNPSRTPIGYTLYRYGVREVRRLLTDDDVEAAKARGSRLTHDQAAALAIETLRR